MIWKHHVQVLIVIASWAFLVCCSSLFVSVGVLALQFCSVYGPCGVLAFL